MSDIFMSSQEPKNAPIMEGIAKRIKTDLLIFFQTKINLKILLKKCTSPVKHIANSTGKKIINTGVSKVPKPKPEKNVRMAKKNAATDIIIISIYKKMIESIDL